MINDTDMTLLLRCLDLPQQHPQLFNTFLQASLHFLRILQQGLDVLRVIATAGVGGIERTEPDFSTPLPLMSNGGSVGLVDPFTCPSCA